VDWTNAIWVTGILVILAILIPGSLLHEALRLLRSKRPVEPQCPKEHVDDDLDPEEKRDDV
jgi:hypothetical protein